MGLDLVEALGYGSWSQWLPNRTSVNFPQGQSSAEVGYCFHALAAMTDLFNGTHYVCRPMFWPALVIIYHWQPFFLHKRL